MSNQSDRSDSDEKISTSLPLEPRKKWFLPKDRSSFVTFIDHGCQLDAEGYPIYPNGSTTFVHDPNIRTFRNFGSVGFTKTMSMEKTRDAEWTVKRIYCLGVLRCDDESCLWAGSPPTGNNVLDKYLIKYVYTIHMSLFVIAQDADVLFKFSPSSKPKCKGAAGHCPGRVFHQACPETSMRIDTHTESGWALLRHQGHHSHPWAEAKKPDPLSKDQLMAMLRANPKAGAFQLKVSFLTVD